MTFKIFDVLNCDFVIIQADRNHSLDSFLGVTTFAKGGTLVTGLSPPFHKSGRAIRATSVASFYPSRNLVVTIILQNCEYLFLE